MGWFRRTKIELTNGHPLYLDGEASWRTYTGPGDARQLRRLPVDKEVAVTAVPEPNNPDDPTAVALFYRGSRVNYLYRSPAGSLFGAISAANAAGYQVLLHAKRTQKVADRNTIEVQIGPRVRTRSNLVLEVRAALAADLLYWLNLPPHERGTEFFQLAWTKTDYQDFYQDRRKALLAAHDSLILPCAFSTASRKANPYGYRPPPHTTPKHPDIGTFADVHAAGQHIGELRTRHSDAVKQILSGVDDGLARLGRWPTNIELRVCIPDADGHLPKSSEPFYWIGVPVILGAAQWFSGLLERPPAYLCDDPARYQESLETLALSRKVWALESEKLVLMRQLSGTRDEQRWDLLRAIARVQDDIDKLTARTDAG